MNCRENLTNCHQCSADKLGATSAAQVSGEVHFSLCKEKNAQLKTLHSRHFYNPAHQLVARLPSRSSPTVAAFSKMEEVFKSPCNSERSDHKLGKPQGTNFRSVLTGCPQAERCPTPAENPPSSCTGFLHAELCSTPFQLPFLQVICSKSRLAL